MDILTIHDIRKEYFELDLDSYRLTFDDGLYSQYYYYPLLKNHPENLTLFITTAFIKPGKARGTFDGRYLPFLKQKRYAYNAFIRGEYRQFMTIDELQALCEHPNVIIGAHSHFHEVILTRTHPGKQKPLSDWKRERFKECLTGHGSEFSVRSSLNFQGYECRSGRAIRRSESAWEDFIRTDTELCLKWFEKYLGFLPDSYCFPFNEFSDRLTAVLKSFGFKTFYAARTQGRENFYSRVDIDSLLGC